jgi:Pilus formation protein N terminal region
MLNQQEGCYRVVRRTRRLRLVLPSLFVGSLVFASPVLAQESMLVPPAAAESSNATPVLKSVGIKFGTSDMKSPRPTTTKSDVTRNAASAIIPPTTLVKPDILMPPLIAGPKSESASQEATKADSVKIELHSGSLPPAVQHPSLLIDGKTSETNTSNTEKGLAPPTLRTPTLEIKPIAKQLPLIAPPANIAEQKTLVSADEKRTPQVVKIPGMTISKPKVIEPPKSASEGIPQASLPVQGLVASKPVNPSVVKNVVPSSPAVSVEPRSLNQENIQVRLTDEPSAAPNTLSPDIATSPLKPAARTTASIPNAAPARPVKALNDLPAVVALPVSRVSSVPVSNESIQDELVRSPAMASQTASSPLGQPRSKPSNLKTVEVHYQNSQTIEIGRSVTRIDIEDESVCRALATKGTSIILMGLNKGQTIITVWSTSGYEETATSESYRINVCDAWAIDSVENHTLNSIASVQESLSQLFPSAEILLKSNSNGSLTIYGKAPSDEQARKIAQLVRKMFLVPVADRVAVISP